MQIGGTSAEFPIYFMYGYGKQTERADEKGNRETGVRGLGSVWDSVVGVAADHAQPTHERHYLT